MTIHKVTNLGSYWYKGLGEARQCLLVGISNNQSATCGQCVDSLGLCSSFGLCNCFFGKRSHSATQRISIDAMTLAIEAATHRTSRIVLTPSRNSVPSYP